MADREKARADLARLQRRDAEIAALRLPFDDAHAAQVAPMVRMAELVEAEREAILEQLGDEVEIVGTCEGCDKLLLTGDQGHRCEDGPILCEACSPTYADALKWFKEANPDAFADPEEHSDGLAHVQGFLDRGGDPATKLAGPL